MKGCELCSGVARVRCESDDASLCFDCDAKVHGANFLVARHQRVLLCRACQSETPWKASGARLGPTVSVCVSCVQERSSSPAGNRDGDQEGESARNQEEDEDDDDDDEDDCEDEEEEEEEEEEEGEEQVVPWAAEVEDGAAPPPVACSSSSEEEEEVKTMVGGFWKRMRGNAPDLPSSSSSDHFSDQPRLPAPVRTGVPDDETILDSFRPLKSRKTTDIHCQSKCYQLF